MKLKNNKLQYWLRIRDVSILPRSVSQSVSQWRFYLLIAGNFLFFPAAPAAPAAPVDAQLIAEKANAFAQQNIPPIDLKFSRKLGFRPTIPNAPAGDDTRYYLLKSDGTNWFCISSRTPIDDDKLISTNYLFFFGRSGGKMWQTSPETGVMSEWADYTDFNHPLEPRSEHSDFFRAFELEATEPLRFGVLQSVPGTLKFAANGTFKAAAITGGEITGIVTNTAIPTEMVVRYTRKLDNLTSFSILTDSNNFAGILPQKISVYRVASGSPQQPTVEYSIERAMVPSQVTILAVTNFAGYYRSTSVLSNSQYYGLIAGTMIPHTELTTTNPQIAKAIIAWVLPYLLVLIFLGLFIVVFFRQRSENKKQHQQNENTKNK